MYILNHFTYTLDLYFFNEGVTTKQTCQCLFCHCTKVEQKYYSVTSTGRAQTEAFQCPHFALFSMHGIKTSPALSPFAHPHHCHNFSLPVFA